MSRNPEKPKTPLPQTRSGKEVPPEPPVMSSYGKAARRLAETRQKKIDLLKKMGRSR